MYFTIQWKQKGISADPELFVPHVYTVHFQVRMRRWGSVSPDLCALRHVRISQVACLSFPFYSYLPSLSKGEFISIDNLSVFCACMSLYGVKRQANG